MSLIDKQKSMRVRWEKKIQLEETTKSTHQAEEETVRRMEAKEKLKRWKAEYRKGIPKLESGVMATYFLQAEITGLIKIGQTTRLSRRLAGLRASSPDNLKIIKAIAHDIEAVCHQEFAHLRVHGEWFRPEPELLNFIEEL